MGKRGALGGPCGIFERKHRGKEVGRTTNIVVVLPKQEDARSIRNLLVRSGFHVAGVCTTGAQALQIVDGLNDGIVISSYKLTDMLYAQLQESLPADFEMLLIASPHLLSERMEGSVVSLAMPLKVVELVNTLSMMVQNIERRRRKRREQPRMRKPEEEALLREAKSLLMERNHMTEEEAHRYLQKCSMDSGTNLVETAQMILVMMNR